MSLDTKVDLSIAATLLGSLDLQSMPRTQLAYTKSLILSSGVNANQADQLWFDTRTVAASSNDDLDLAGGLTNGLGQTVTFVRIKGLFVFPSAANTNNVNIGGGSNTFSTWLGAAGDIVVTRPGGFFGLYAPDATAYAVTATTGDILRLSNSGAGTSVDYDIILVGATA